MDISEGSMWGRGHVYHLGKDLTRPCLWIKSPMCQMNLRPYQEVSCLEGWTIPRGLCSDS